MRRRTFPLLLALVAAGGYSASGMLSGPRGPDASRHDGPAPPPLVGLAVPPDAAAARGTLRVCRWLPPPGEPWRGLNAGDDMVPDLLRAVVARAAPGIQVVDAAGNYANKEWDPPCLWATGTLLHQVRPGDAVWGSGAYGPAKGTCPQPSVEIAAVRGPLTARWLETSCGRSDPPTAFGDPAILLPLLFPEIRALPAANRTTPCAIPHGRHSSEMLAELALLPAGTVTLLDPRQRWRPFMAALASCSLALSCSLHGLILAEVIGIPARLVAYPSLGSEGHKYADYYASTGREGEAGARSLAEGLRIGGRQLPTGLDGLREGLLRAFPWGAVLGLLNRTTGVVEPRE
ncbi:hypothetical protein DFJ74DRAFT_365213 [Hyaloraphidium curvatum]|nr:hypothetical protein DFJ74DRAFT_365213 [Hyaloraphidium curvatum]